MIFKNSSFSKKDALKSISENLILILISEIDILLIENSMKKYIPFQCKDKISSRLY